MSLKNGESDTQGNDLDLPDTVWDEYEGAHVFVEFNCTYAAVSDRGGFCRTPVDPANPKGPWETIRMNLMAGILRVKKDRRGNVRLTIQSRDPAEDSKDFVRADFSPDTVHNITVTLPGPRIISGEQA